MRSICRSLSLGVVAFWGRTLPKRFWVLDTVYTFLAATFHIQTVLLQPEPHRLLLIYATLTLSLLPAKEWMPHITLAHSPRLGAARRISMPSTSLARLR